MISFKTFLLESNNAGLKFEESIAENVQSWLKKNNLNEKFSAKRYDIESDEDEKEDNLNSKGGGEEDDDLDSKGGGEEDDDLDSKGREEDYSDVIVENLESQDRFFIECKKDLRTNIITTMFDINEDFSITPVRGKSREPIEDEIYIQLADLVSQNEDFQKFIEFLKKPNDMFGNKKPSDFYFGNEDIGEKELNSILKEYNKKVDAEEYEADCKSFDLDMVRDSTRNMLACGVLWKMSNEKSTWDICRLTNIDFYYQLVIDHYQKQKKLPARYMQASNNLFVFDRGENPMNIDCTEFPKDITGSYDLKFTPRFGSGAMYVTPRSGIETEISSDQSFTDEEKWPKLIS